MGKAFPGTSGCTPPDNQLHQRFVDNLALANSDGTPTFVYRLNEQAG